jgi:hypothetical protein
MPGPAARKPARRAADEAGGDDGGRDDVIAGVDAVGVGWRHVGRRREGFVVTSGAPPAAEASR